MRDSRNASFFAKTITLALSLGLGSTLHAAPDDMRAPAFDAPLSLLDDDDDDDDEANAGDEGNETDGWISGRLATMTLREKIGQLFMVDLKENTYTPELAQKLAAHEFGNVILFERNLKDADQTRQFIERLQTQALVRTGVPMLVAVDQEGGSVNRLGAVTAVPSMKHSARRLGEVYSYAPARATKLLARLAGEIAVEMRKIGINMNLAPVLDLTDDRLSYIYNRSFGNDPTKVSRIARTYARTMSSHGIASTGKHFPNLSLTRTDSHKALPVLARSRQQMLDHELLPFKHLKDELDAVMVGHVRVPSIDANLPASVSRKIIGLLRKEIGYQGLLISDDLKMRALTDQFSVKEIVLLGMSAGIDVFIVAWDYDKQREAARTLEKAFQRGNISMARLDESVRRILTLKRKLAAAP